MYYSKTFSSCPPNLIAEWMTLSFIFFWMFNRNRGGGHFCRKGSKHPSLSNVKTTCIQAKQTDFGHLSKKGTPTKLYPAQCANLGYDWVTAESQNLLFRALWCSQKFQFMPSPVNFIYYDNEIKFPLASEKSEDLEKGGSRGWAGPIQTVLEQGIWRHLFFVLTQQGKNECFYPHWKHGASYMYSSEP